MPRVSNGCRIIGTTFLVQIEKINIINSPPPPQEKLWDFVYADDEYPTPNVWYPCLSQNADSFSHVKLKPERQKVLWYMGDGGSANFSLVTGESMGYLSQVVIYFFSQGMQVSNCSCYFVLELFETELQWKLGKRTVWNVKIAKCAEAAVHFVSQNLWLKDAA